MRYVEPPSNFLQIEKSIRRSTFLDIENPGNIGGARLENFSFFNSHFRAGKVINLSNFGPGPTSSSLTPNYSLSCDLKDTKSSSNQKIMIFSNYISTLSGRKPIDFGESKRTEHSNAVFSKLGSSGFPI